MITFGESVLPHQLSHPWPILLATLVQRSVVVIERRIVPARTPACLRTKQGSPVIDVTPSGVVTGRWA